MAFSEVYFHASSFMAFEESIDVHNELHDVRTSAIKNFENKGFPTKKEEAWKYTSLNAILKNDYSVFPGFFFFGWEAFIFKVFYSRSSNVMKFIVNIDSFFKRHKRGYKFIF